MRRGSTDFISHAQSCSRPARFRVEVMMDISSAGTFLAGEKPSSLDNICIGKEKERPLPTAAV